MDLIEGSEDAVMGEAVADQPRAIDIGQLIDAQPWSRRQTQAVLLTALAVIMDGLDNRLLPLAIPPLLKEWGVQRDAFALATSVGLIGMALGTTAGGMIGDRIGRRRTIIFSVLAFGLATFANAFVNDINAMIAMRLLAGMGLGGLMPAAAAMFAEFAPTHRRALAVTLGMVCVPAGGALSGLLGAAVLPEPGWRALFLIGGGIAIAIGLVQLAWLPESPRFLARSPANRARLTSLLADMGIELGEGDPVPGGAESGAARGSVAALFAPGRVRDTIGLWGAFFAILLCLYMESQWMPTILTGAGYSIRVASIASSCLSIGGMFACILGVGAVRWFGSRIGLMGMAAAGVVVTLGLTQYPIDPGRSAVPLLVLLTLAGFLIGGLQIMIYAVATHAYPTALRATGIGWAVGIGRLGSVVSPFLATAALASAGWGGFFVWLAVGLAVTMASLGLIKNHVPAARR